MSETSSRISVVFDCMVFLQAIVNADGPAGVCFHKVKTGMLHLFVSAEILGELEGVLSDPKLRRQFPQLNNTIVSGFFVELSEISTTLPFVPTRTELRRDMKDEKYLNASIECGASYLITRDRDLLDLMTDYSDEAKEFRRKFRKLKIVTPVYFLKILPPLSS